MSRFLWLVRRELWETRSAWLAPAVCAAVVIGSMLVGVYVTGAINIDRMDAETATKIHSHLTPDKVDGLMGLALSLIAMPFFLVMLVVQFFYAIDTLYAERRDRSILFWKSLPVSDTETVLSKLTIALVVMPLIAAAAAFVTQLVVFAILAPVLSGEPLLTGHFFSPATWAGEVVVMLWVVFVSALWYLPVVAWAMLVSAWAPRSPLTWAMLPPAALVLAEYIAFHSLHTLRIVGERVLTLSIFGRAFSHAHDGAVAVVIDREDRMDIPHSVVSMIDPIRFLSTIEVWGGVAVAVAFVAGAIWIRRYRDASA